MWFPKIRLFHNRQWWNQARNQGGRRGGEAPHRNIFASPGKMFWTKFKSIGYSLKNLSPSQTTLRPLWRPKLVTGLGGNACWDEEMQPR